MSCGVGCTRGLDLVLPWLWCRPAAVALTQPLAWEPPYATGMALKKTNKKKNKQKNGDGSCCVELLQVLNEIKHLC